MLCSMSNDVYLFHNAIFVLFYRKNHTDQLKNLMIDIVTVILAEYDLVPFSLLELLFARIIDPEKVITILDFLNNFFLLLCSQKLREECYELVESIIRRAETCLKPAIAEVQHDTSSTCFNFPFSLSLVFQSCSHH